jgi:hypothetical protein
LFLNTFAGFAQVDSARFWYTSEAPAASGTGELMYDVHSRSNLPVTKEKLATAVFLRDFISYFPEHWIDAYISSEVSAAVPGRRMNEVSPNDHLTNEQKSLLNSLGVGTDLVVCVNYKTKNSGTGRVEERIMKLTLTVMPETEAAYADGYPEMSKYFWNHAITKIKPDVSKNLEAAHVGFVVNETGEITGTKMVVSSGDLKTDQLLMDAVSKMPRWKPAESKGIKVKQAFVFSVYGNGYGC